MPEFLPYLLLSSGLFLGWSLGANDAANIFGTAVGSRMVTFRTAALVSCVMVMVGAVVSGAGASKTLGQLGAINTIGGSFTVVLSAAVTVYLMTKAKAPVSTSQAIVGGIVAWNVFVGAETDMGVLYKIMDTWILCPIFSALVAIVLYMCIDLILRKCPIHLFHLDMFTRYGLIMAGVFGAYALGANNIGNVVGVFIPDNPFPSLDLGLFVLSPLQVLFFIGAGAIGMGIATYSKRIMMTVGKEMLQLSPIAAFVAVTAHSVSLMLFSSTRLESLLLSLGLPAIPLVPVSSSQAIVGAILGIGILKGGRNIRWRVINKIVVSWVITPVSAFLLGLLLLAVMQNLFGMTVAQ